MMKLDIMLKSNELARSLRKSIARGERKKAGFFAMIELVFSYGNNIVYFYGALLKACASLSARYLDALSYRTVCCRVLGEVFLLFRLLKPGSGIFQWG